MKSLLNNLRLVCCPLTNRECDFLWEDEGTRSFLKQSKLYLIGQRSEVFFENFAGDDDHGITFDLVGQNQKRLPGIRLHLSQMFEPPKDGFEIDAGKKIVRVYGENQQLLKWWTVDKLLFEYWRGDVIADGLESYRVFTDYDLHYVGISKEGDSFSRLFKNGHEKRTKILSQERQLVPTASLTDEIFIFFFTVEPLGFNTIMSPEELGTILSEWIPDEKNLVADAEKALVKILDSEYNEVKYEGYPKGLDGIFDQGLSRYAYLIGEDMSFSTYNSSIRGLTFDPRCQDDSADLIAVEGENVRLYKKEDMIGGDVQPT